MQPNPYQAPTSPAGYPPFAPPATSRRPFVLAAIGAWLASAYWAGLTGLLTLGVAAGSVSPMQIALPGVLIALYAYRGYQIFQGDRRAAQRILWLHGVGGVMAVIAMASGGQLMLVLHGTKVAIHVFGAYAAYRASRLPVGDGVQPAGM